MTLRGTWFPWNGSKRWLLSELEPVLSQWDGRGRYFDPFCGGGSVSALMRRLFPRARQIVSDANPWLASAFRTQAAGDYKLPANYGDVTYWRSLRDDQRRELSRVERATRFAVCLYSSWGNRWKTAPDGAFTQSSAPINPKWSTRTYLKPRLESMFHSSSSWLHKSDVIRHWDWKTAAFHAKPGDLVYLDPPYPESLGYGTQWWSFSDQLDIVDWVTEAIPRGIRVVVSNMATLERLYKRAGMKTRIIDYPRSSRTSRPRQEVLAWRVR